jgi:hypothetical protein
MRRLASLWAAAFPLALLPLIVHAQTPVACDLLSPETAASLLKNPVARNSDFSDVLCSYAAKPEGAYVVLTATDSSVTESEDYIRNRGGAGRGTQTESIPGLGDKNLFIASAHENTLTVFWHHKMVELFVKSDAGPSLKTAMVQAMRAILARL